MRRQADVLVIGGGPAGATTAIACAQRGLTTILVEAGSQSQRRLGESLSALGTKPLEELGIFQEFLAQAHTPTHSLRTSWAGSVVERDAIRHGFGPDYHLDRARFDEWLLAKAEQRGASVLRAVVKLHLAREARDRFVARAESNGQGLSVQARAVIDATGRRAFAMRQLGAHVTRTDRLLGFARWFERGTTEAMVLVEATREGWWYSAPTPAEGRVAAFFTDVAPNARRSRREGLWETALGLAPLTSQLIGKLDPGPIEAYAASPQITEWTPDGPYLPVGDAAFAADPIGGAGLVLALSSGAEAARAVELYFRGSPNVLRSYRDGVRRLFTRHLAERESAYAGERALQPRSEFWARPRN